MIGGAVGGCWVSLLHANVYIFTGVGFPYERASCLLRICHPGTIGCLAGGAVTFALAMVFFKGLKIRSRRFQSGDSEVVHLRGAQEALPPKRFPPPWAQR